MKRISWTLGIIVAAGVASAIAQPPGGPGGRGGPPGGPGGGHPPIPVIEALDADHDHVISADEIKNAPTALLTLDKNNDGQLTENEFGPQMSGPGGRRGRPAGGGRGPRGGERRRQPGGPEGRGPAGGPGGGPAGDPHDGPPPPNPERMVEHAMEFDTDKDGKLSKEELMKFAEEFAKHHPPGGPHHDGPEGDGSNENERPQRPRRPE